MRRRWVLWLRSKRIALVTVTWVFWHPFFAFSSGDGITGLRLPNVEVWALGGVSRVPCWTFFNTMGTWTWRGIAEWWRFGRGESVVDLAWCNRGRTFSVSLSYWESDSVSKLALETGAFSLPNVKEMSVFLWKAEGRIPPAPCLSGEVTFVMTSLAMSIGCPKARKHVWKSSLVTDVTPSTRWRARRSRPVGPEGAVLFFDALSAKTRLRSYQEMYKLNW